MNERQLGLHVPQIVGKTRRSVYREGDNGTKNQGLQDEMTNAAQANRLVLYHILARTSFARDFTFSVARSPRLLSSRGSKPSSAAADYPASSLAGQP